MTTLSSGIKLDSNPSDAVLKVRQLSAFTLAAHHGASALHVARCLLRTATHIDLRSHGVTWPQELGVRSWPTWGCDASKFPWSYSSAETAYVLKGRVIVTPDGGEPVEVRRSCWPPGLCRLLCA